MRPGLELLDRLSGGPMVAALLKVATAGLTAERAVGVGDPVSLAALIDAGDQPGRHRRRSRCQPEPTSDRFHHQRDATHLFGWPALSHSLVQTSFRG